MGDPLRVGGAGEDYRAGAVRGSRLLFGLETR